MARTFLTLPVEVRTRVYEFVFRGERVVWERKLAISKHQDLETEVWIKSWDSRHGVCLNIRLVCRKCYTETYLPFFLEVEFDITNLTDTYYGVLNANMIDATMLRKVVLRNFEGWNEKASKLIEAMPNLTKFTFKYRKTYDYRVEERAYGERLDKHIKANPAKALGDIYPAVWMKPKSQLRSVINVWKEGGRAFELVGEVDIRVNICKRFAVGQVNLATGVMKIIDVYDWEVKGEIVLDRMKF